jgi:hypothetical protein
LLELVEVYQIIHIEHRKLSFAEIKSKVYENFKEFKVLYFIGWNINDFLLPFMFALHVFFYYYWHQYEEDRKYKALTFNYITIALLFQGVFKCLQYVRVIDSFGFLVEMIL